MSKQYLDDFDTGVDCGMPAAIVVIIWATAISCVIGTLITIAAIAALVGVGR